jgi:hypothetical protein
MSANETLIPLTARAFCLGLLALIAMLLAPVAALARAPEYSLSIVEGESTLPEFQIAGTSARVEPRAPAVISIIRGGIVVAQSTGTEYVGMSQVPQAGDLLTLQSPPGNVVGSVIYDGLPSIDPTVCAGSASFSGQRSGAEPVSGGYYSLALRTDPYGHTSEHETNSGQAQVTALAGPAYAGNFLAPLSLGQTVQATESLETPLAGGAVFSYSSENDRPVGSCPAPPVIAPPPPPPALAGTIFKLSRTTVRRLLKSGWTTQVSINQPGIVVEDLYLQGGKLPAFASTTKSSHRKRKPAALLLARGSTSVKVPGRVSVLLRATAKGRRRLKRTAKVKAVLVTTLISTSGAKLNLGHRSVTLRP